MMMMMMTWLLYCINDAYRVGLLIMVNKMVGSMQTMEGEKVNVASIRPPVASSASVGRSVGRRHRASSVGRAHKRLTYIHHQQNTELSLLDHGILVGRFLSLSWLLDTIDGPREVDLYDHER